MTFTPRFLATLSCIFLALTVPAWSQTADAAKPARWNVPFQPLGFAWVNLSPQTGPIQRVGNKRLPIPFQLPRGLTPLGHKALMTLLPPGSHSIAFALFFPANEQTRLRAWLGGQPRELPLNVRQHRVVKGPVVENHRTYWHIHFVVQVASQTSDVRVVLDSMGYPLGVGQPSGPLSDDDLGDKLMKSLTAPVSPVRGLPAFEQVEVKYVVPND